LSDWWWTYPLAPPDWRAVSGFAAVGAALFVGLKQIQISKDLKELQQRIAEDDFRLREQSLRVDLLERRTKCVVAIRQIVSVWSQNAELSDDEFRRFNDLLGEAKLIFPPDVVEKIDQALRSLFWAKMLRKRSLDYHNQGKAEKAAAKLEQSFANEDQADNVMPELVAMLERHTRVNGWTEPS
jgi:hypothetical protein